MNRTTLTSRLTGIILASLFCVAANAQTCDETIDGGGEAGDLPGTAQVITGPGLLSQITGVLQGPSDRDMYALFITNPAAFSATSTGGFPYVPPRMFLFDAAGNGVSGYFDSTNAGASLSGAFVPSPGLYSLAISGLSYPWDASDRDIWYGSGLSDVERAPDGLGAANPVDGWSQSIVPYGPHSYTITLTGAAPVPELTTLAPLALGGLAALGLRRRVRRVVPILILGMLAVVYTPPANADWSPGDPYGMHFPQRPLPSGAPSWTVDITNYLVADDFVSAGGSITDVHFWFGWKGGFVGQIDNVHLEIYSSVDRPGNPSLQQPDALLWQKDFVVGDFAVAGPIGGIMSWLDPNPSSPQIYINDHQQFYQLNVTNIANPFAAQQGAHYWLAIQVDVSPLTVGDEPLLGWVNSNDHLLSPESWASVWRGGSTWDMNQLPGSPTFFSQAFVVVLEPATMGLLALGGLALIRRRWRTAADCAAGKGVGVNTLSKPQRGGDHRGAGGKDARRGP